MCKCVCVWPCVVEVCKGAMRCVYTHVCENPVMVQAPVSVYSQVALCIMLVALSFEHSDPCVCVYVTCSID